MRHSSIVQRVRDLVRQHLVEQGNCPEDCELSETLLVRDGHYCGRRFESATAHAIWFCEENQLKIYGPNGKIAQVIADIEPAPQPMHREAA